MTREEIIDGLYKGDGRAIKAAIKALEQEPCEDAISREDAILALDKIFDSVPMELTTEILALRTALRKKLPSVQPLPKTGHWISIDDVMSVFDDFMCGEVDEDGTNIFLEMLKDKAESEVQDDI